MVEKKRASGSGGDDGSIGEKGGGGLRGSGDGWRCAARRGEIGRNVPLGESCGCSGASEGGNGGLWSKREGKTKKDCGAKEKEVWWGEMGEMPPKMSQKERKPPVRGALNGPKMGESGGRKW